MLNTKKVQYSEGDTLLEGYLAQDSQKTGKQPAVLVVHDWSGRNDFACQKAEQLAELGYVGFAVDMYGSAQVATTTAEKQALMMPLITDRALLKRRIIAAYETVCAMDAVNTARIAVMGFCFGGLCALDLARHGADIKGALSFHGLLSPPTGLQNSKITAKILVLHGHEDPMVSPENMADFQMEMTRAGVDWQAHIYGNAQHAFTNPHAQDKALGLMYNTVAAKRAWLSMQNFFSEIFS